MEKLKDSLHAFFDKKTIIQKKMAMAWVIAVAVLVVFGLMFQGANVSFNGIAESAETNVSVQSAVEIIKVHVQLGEEVQEGDTLVELSRPDLIMRLNEIRRELDALEGRGTQSLASVDQKVAEIQADLNTRRNTLKFEIQKLEEEYKQNKEISSRLKSLKGSASSDGNDAMAIRIKSLKQELAVLEQNAATQINLLRGSKGKQAKSNTAEADALKKEIALLEEQQKEQTIIAKGNFVVASILAREGEKVSAFNPIVTLTRKEPTQVRGYLNETYYDGIEIGDWVEVKSPATGASTQGEVIGMSSQIVPFPVRLLKMPEFPMYGREVNISIPSNSGFLLGEKLLVSKLSGIKSLMVKKTGGESK